MQENFVYLGYARKLHIFGQFLRYSVILVPFSTLFSFFLSTVVQFDHKFHTKTENLSIISKFSNIIMIRFSNIVSQY